MTPKRCLIIGITRMNSISGGPSDEYPTAWQNIGWDSRDDRCSWLRHGRWDLLIVRGCSDMWPGRSCSEFVRRLVAGESPWRYDTAKYALILVVYHNDEEIPWPDDHRCIMTYSDEVLTDYPKARFLWMLKRKIGIPAEIFDEVSDCLNMPTEERDVLVRRLPNSALPRIDDLAHALIKPFCSIDLCLQRWEGGFAETDRRELLGKTSRQRVEQAELESRRRLYVRFVKKGSPKNTIEGLVLVDSRTSSDAMASWREVKALLPEAELSRVGDSDPSLHRYLAARAFLARLETDLGAILLQQELVARPRSLDPFRQWFSEFIAALDKVVSFYVESRAQWC